MQTKIKLITNAVKSLKRVLKRENFQKIWQEEKAQMNQDKSLEFMQIAMKYLPEAKAKLDEAGIELSFEMLSPFMELFTNVMNEAYELGKKDALEE